MHECLAERSCADSTGKFAGRSLRDRSAKRGEIHGAGSSPNFRDSIGPGLCCPADRLDAGSYEFRSGIGPLGLPLALQVINDTPYRVIYAGYQLYSGQEWAFPVLWDETQPGEMLQWLLYTEANMVDATILLKDSAGNKWSLAVQRFRFENPLSQCDRLRFNAVSSYTMADARGGGRNGLCHSRGSGSGRGVDVHDGYSLTVRLSELEV